MNSKFAFFAAGALMASASFAAIENVAWSQNADTKLVTVTYNLTGEAPMIVTLDVLLDGASIGQENVTCLSGDVNKLVQPGEGYTIKWRPDYDWNNKPDGSSPLTCKVVGWAKEDPPDYLAVSIGLCTQQVRYYTCEAALPGGLSDPRWRHTWLLMRRIHAGGKTFIMGTPEGSVWHNNCYKSGSLWKEDGVHFMLSEKQHEVGFSKDFYMAVFPTTYCQDGYICGALSADNNVALGYACPARRNWNSIRGENTWPGKDPATDSVLDKLRTLTGVAFDLPTEAQWEYCCRAGTTTQLYTGDGMVQDSSYVYTTAQTACMWCWGGHNEAGRQAVSPNGYNFWIPVGLLTGNAWGLHDLHGSGHQWCLDWVAEDTVGLPDAVDPIGLESGEYKAVRGQALTRWAPHGRSGSRMSMAPATGSGDGDNLIYRLVCPCPAL